MSVADCRKAFSDKLLEIAAQNPAIYAITSDARGSSTVASFAKKLPERFVEAGIAEQNEIGVAAGLAIMGKIPFVCAPAAFLSARAAEQIKLDVSYSEKPVKVVGVSAGLAYGTAGMSHYSINDFAVMRSFFGLDVFAPSDAYQSACLTELIAASPTAAYMRIGRSPVPNVYKGDESFEIGKAYKLRAGDDITLIACGRMVYPAIKAAERLEQAGIHTRVLDMFTIKPLDEEAIIAAARETNGIITIEEHVQTGGLGEAVGAVLCCKAPAPMRILALPDEHLICGSDQEILDHYGLNVEGIICAANKFIQGN